MKNRLIFLMIYGSLIIILLVIILFVIPDDAFLKKYENNYNKIMENTNVELEQAETEYLDFKEQQKHLENNHYSYSYQILTPVSQELNAIYNCSGTVSGSNEEGTCTKPRKIEFTEQNKSKELNKVNMNYLNPSYLFNIINELDVEPIDYTGFRIYTYNTKLNNLETKIKIATDRENIVQIEIDNVKENYVLKYSDISY